MTAEAALAVDLGGTDLRAALVARDGRVLAHAAEPTRARAGPEAVIAQIAALAGRVMAERPGLRPIGMGIGAPGPLDPLAGLMIAPPTLDGWQNVPLAARLRERLGLPVWLENDANAAALGEWRFGAGRGQGTVVFVTVSTGIGGGVITQGRVFHGSRGLAAEIGHMTIAGSGPRCFCGAVGCFEALASGTALGRNGGRLAKRPGGEAIAQQAEGGRITARSVVGAARAGDAMAAGLVADEARWLGRGFTNLLHLYSPDVIVLGGGLANAFDLLIGGIRAEINRRAMPAYRDVAVVPAALGSRAGLIGAAGLVFTAQDMQPGPHGAGAMEGGRQDG
ncbi:ROK family protein [Fertoebacter nigrum]|uniref:ROK family protein n=1 Tax=Fertoeibacter niger TaxID=2656921 RepID=A0A8X8GVQ5_9RHOB|nr:ROK family protein [Fertoeibacter niger]NUB45249.1 ROK family protein [Fertoeibacter niger]